MIEIADHDFVPCTEAFGERQTYDPDERRRIHTECDLIRFAGVDEERHVFPGTLNGCVDLDAPTIASATLHVARNQMVSHSIKHNLGYLRACTVVEEDELFAVIKRGKLLTYPLCRKIGHRTMAGVPYK